MKTSYVTDLLSEQTITTFFLVHEKEVRNTREGRAYLRMELGDRSGTIEARMWDQFEVIARDINRDDFVKVQARVEVYKNRPQLAIVQVRVAKPDEIDLADYLPHTKHDVEKMWAELHGYAESIGNPWLKKLVTQMLAQPDLARCYKRAPAAKVMHHAYLGGLLEHVVSICGMAKQAAAHYAELDLDLLLSAAILHDVGKLEELCYERAIGYTTPGQLLGHIVMELETVSRSPKLPMIREAMVFHYLDDLDSKLAAVRVALATPSGDDEWSTYSGALGRKFLKLDAFLKSNAAASTGDAAAAEPAQQAMSWQSAPEQK
jgi:3'-5' exoribonuclease